MRLLRRLRRPAVRLGLEPLEPRCACSTGGFTLVSAPGLVLVPDHPPTVPELVSPPAPGAAPPPAVVGPLPAHLPTAPGPVAPQEPGIAPPPVPGLHGTGYILHLPVHTHYNGVVAHFDGDADDAPRMSVNIGWGEGHWTGGAISPNQTGGYDVVGAVTYDSPGSYPITVQLTGPDGTQATANSQAVVFPEGSNSFPSPSPSPGSSSDFTPSGGDAVPPVPPRPPAPPPPRSTPPAGSPPSDAPAQIGLSRPPADDTGSVPWVRRPDPRPAATGAGNGRPGPADGPGQTTTAMSAETADGLVAATPAGNEQPIRPDYLNEADALAPDPAVIPAVPLPIDLRPPALPTPFVYGGPAGRSIGDPLLPGADADRAGRPGAGATPAECAAVAVVAAEAWDRHDPGRSETGWRRAGLWCRGLAWGLALVVTERLLAGRWTDRTARTFGLRWRAAADVTCEPPPVENPR